MASGRFSNRSRRPLGRKGKLIVGPLFLAIGILFVLIAFGMTFNSLRSSNWPTTQGTVTSVEQDQNRRRSSSSGVRRTSTTYKPTAEYTVDGERYSVKSSIGTNESFSVGDPIEVKYNPGDPSDGVVQTAGMGFGAAIFFIIGSILTIIGGFLLRSALKAKQQEV